MKIILKLKNKKKVINILYKILKFNQKSTFNFYIFKNFLTFLFFIIRVFYNIII